MCRLLLSACGKSNPSVGPGSPGTAMTWLDLVRKVEGKRVDIGKVINSVCQAPGQSQPFCAAQNANEITGC